MQLELFRHGADGKCFGAFLHYQKLVLGLRSVLLESHRHSRVLLIHLRVLAEQLFRLFRNHLGKNYLRFNKLIAMRVRIAQRRRALATQTEFLARLCARWNPQLSFAGNRGHFNFSAQRRLGHGDRNSHVDVVALSSEMRMTSHVRDDEQVAGRCAEPSAFAFSGNAHTRARVYARGNAHFDRLSFGENAFAAAQRARRAAFAGASAIRTLLRESQTPAGTLHLSCAFACRTRADCTAGVSRAVTTRTLLGSVYG